MTRQPTIAARVEQLLRRTVVSTAPVAGGDVSVVTRARLADGTQVVVKTMPGAPASLFTAEARGLLLLGQTLPTPEVLAAESDCLVLSWIEPGRPTEAGAAQFGRALAATHRRTADSFGAEADGFIGPLPMSNTPASNWAEFFAVRRIAPYLRAALDRGALTREDAAVIEQVAARLPDLVPTEPPALLHGDLWNGNVVWDADGEAVVIDPASYFGHRETDLAMLALFGLPHLETVMDAYREQWPPEPGWEERVGLHQLFPLLVHARLFGGGYGARAARIARKFA